MSKGNRQRRANRQERRRADSLKRKEKEKHVRKRYLEPPYDEWAEATLTSEDMKLKRMCEFAPDRVWMNSRYQVLVYNDTEVGPGWPPMHWLSIKRRDKNTIRDWRDLQRIKNDLIGPENEAVEIFPAESRLVDTSNQYHLYVLADPVERFPFGFEMRLVSEAPFTSTTGRSKQRPFPVDNRPDDLKTDREIRDATDKLRDESSVTAIRSGEKIVVAKRGLVDYSEDAIQYGVAIHLLRVLQMQRVLPEDTGPMRRWVAYLADTILSQDRSLPGPPECEQIYHAANALRHRLTYGAVSRDDDALEALMRYWPPAPDRVDAATGTEHPGGA